jgi:hypothetical protein
MPNLGFQDAALFAMICPGGGMKRRLAGLLGT